MAPAAGGVIIPYLGTIDLTNTRPGQGYSFGYSDCLKWGYEGSLLVAAFNATQAVGILGLDLTRVGRHSNCGQSRCTATSCLFAHIHLCRD